MNEITIKLSPEQIAIMNKMLIPYVELYASINNAYKLQKEYETTDDFEEADKRG